MFDESIVKPKDVNEEEEEVDIPIENLDINEQGKDDEVKENPQEVEEIEPIDPSLPRNWKYAQSHPKDQIIGDPS